MFATGDMLKLGYDPESCMKETVKEISSRTGSIIDGKFQKDKNQPKDTLYKANYSKCKL